MGCGVTPRLESRQGRRPGAGRLVQPAYTSSLATASGLPSPPLLTCKRINRLANDDQASPEVRGAITSPLAARRGTSPEQVNSWSACAGVGGTKELQRKLRDPPIAQFDGNAFVRHSRCKRKAGLLRINPGIPVFAILAEPRSGSLKFVVNSRLPIGPLRQQHYMIESSRRHETCSGGVQRRLELKGGRLPGVRHRSNLETRIRGLR